MLLGQRLQATRKQKKLSQAALGKLAGTSGDVIGRYERGDIKPSIDAVVKLAEVLNISIDYLVGKNDEVDLLKDPTMVQRLRDLIALKDKEREHVLFALDAMIQNVKLRELTAA